MEKTTGSKYNLWQNTAYMIRRAWQTEKSVLWILLALVAAKVLCSTAELLIAPVILRKVEQAAPLSELLWCIAAFVLALMLLAGLRGYLEANEIFGKIDVRCGITRDINYKKMTTSYPNAEDPAVLKLEEKARTACGGNDEATEAIWETLQSLLVNALCFGIYLALLTNLNPLLLAVVLVTTVAAYFSGKRILEWGYRHREEEADADKRIRYFRNRTTDVGLAKDLRIFGMRPWLESLYDGAVRLYDDFVARREKKYLLADGIDILLSLLRNGVAYGYLIFLTVRDNLPASQFLLYFSAVSGFTDYVTGILSGFSTLHKQSLDISAVRAYIELPEPFRFEDACALHPAPDAAYELRLDHVSFRYPGAAEDTIHDLCLTIHPGEKLAVVGLNGAGKTTMIKLLCGFYDPTEGRVLLNGEDIRRYNRRDYYALFSAVFQQFSVLAVTVEENIAQCTQDIDTERVRRCIAQAGLTEKIQSLPMREKTYVGKTVYPDGEELSGGQTQRLMLARALYKDAPIIVLDEPTAALDPIAEDDIYRKYNDLTAGRTSVFISHRLASTRFCDRILFLDHGAIAEEGTHASLLAAGGKYAKLFAVQSKYYQEGRDADEKEEIAAV